MRRRYPLHALEGLEAALSLPGLGGLGAEAFDEGFHLFDFPLLAGEERCLLRQL